MNLGELSNRMRLLNAWSLEESWIVKDFYFKDFKDALIFVNKVAEIAERQNHHPDITLSYGHVRVSLTTHDSKGLTEKDFVLAEEIDRIDSD